MKRKSLLIVGSGGHASVVLDAANLMQLWDSILILDQTKEGIVLDVHDVYANRHQYKPTHEVFVAIGDNLNREKVTNELISEGFSLATIVHPSAIVAESASMGEGSCVLAGAILNPYTTIGKGVIVNTSASLDHHNHIGDYTHVCPGSVLAGDVTIGTHCFLGTGSVVSSQIEITNHVTLGAGCVVVKSITEPGTYVGVPARKR
jgi:sugar O-acyltransferase (sialic acid O-acetyltransferase NeuD family)